MLVVVAILVCRNVFYCPYDCRRGLQAHVPHSLHPLQGGTLDKVVVEAAAAAADDDDTHSTAARMAQH